MPPTGRPFGNWIRRKLRAWLGIVDAPTVRQDDTRRAMSIHPSVLEGTNRKPPEKKLGPPALMPGVVPAVMPAHDPHLGSYLALDSADMASVYNYAGTLYSGLAFPGYPYLSELTQRSEYREPSETIAAEATREWITLTTKGGKGKQDGETENKLDKPANEQDLASDALGIDDDAETVGAGEQLADPKKNALQEKLEQLDEALQTFCVREHFRKLTVLDGFFGRGQLYIDLGKPESNQLPLVIDKATIPKGALKGFKVIEPIWTTPYSYGTVDPTASDFYVPRAWFVMGRRIHASRLLTFISREVPDIMKPAYNFSGMSLSQLMEPYVYQWLRTRNSVSDLVHNFSVMVLKTDMSQVLAGHADKPGGLMDRAALFTRTRDNQGLTLLDKENEDLGAVNVPLSTLDKLQAQAQEHMAAPSHIPLVKLLGISPAGLNASSEGEIAVFYDYIRAFQQAFFAPHLKTVLQILQLHLFGEIDDAIDFEFVPLSSPTAKELSEIRKANAETDATYIDKGVISPDEVRVKVANDPESGYNNLEGDAPPPPQQLDAEHGAEIGEESAQAGHERALELEKQKASSKPKAAYV